jgi:uncharacterized protein
MSDLGKPVWHDLTVPDAPGVRAFYEKVIGWSFEPHPMGDYDDYSMKAADGAVVTGVCHARGTNANVPPQWLIYFKVKSVADAAKSCAASGGRVIDGPRQMGRVDFCVVQDPAGAVCALVSEREPA